MTEFKESLLANGCMDAVHCPQEWMAKNIVEWLGSKHGKHEEWEDTLWDDETINTCYSPYINGYGSLHWYKKEGYNIISYEDALADIKEKYLVFGNVVEINDRFFLLLPTPDPSLPKAFVASDGAFYASEYTKENISKITKIYKFDENYHYRPFFRGNIDKGNLSSLELVWEDLGNKDQDRIDELRKIIDNAETELKELEV